jgi:hypothetical protein
VYQFLVIVLASQAGNVLLLLGNLLLECQQLLIMALLRIFDFCYLILSKFANGKNVYLIFERNDKSAVFGIVVLFGFQISERDINLIE